LSEKKTYTVVTCAFGDPFWERVLIARLKVQDPARLVEIVLVDQNRHADPKTGLGERVRVVSFEPDDEHLRMLGHDHGASLNKALQLGIRTSHIIILDTDCIPVDATFLDIIDSIDSPILAADPLKSGLTHPCFMVLPTGCLTYVDFSEGLLELGVDTGRLVGLQLLKSGWNPVVMGATSAAWGRGHLYLENTLYHHGSGSMGSSTDHRLKRQVSAWSENYFRKRILEGDWQPRFRDRLMLFVSLLDKLFYRIRLTRNEVQ
jgi:hypothetical protein